MKATSGPAKLLGDVLEPIGRALTPVSAREILSIRARDSEQRRLEELAAKCDQGRLTPEEKAEYELFVEVGDLIALLQARAKRYLAEHPS